MDEHTLQKVKALSREIVEKEFPEEAEYFDFVFSLTIEEIEELEPGKEEEFLKDIRAIHPELALGFAPIIIMLAVQILQDITYQNLSDKAIKKRILTALKVKYPDAYKEMEK